MKKRIGLILLSIGMVCVLTSCGKKEEKLDYINPDPIADHGIVIEDDIMEEEPFIEDEDDYEFEVYYDEETGEVTKEDGTVLTNEEMEDRTGAIDVYGEWFTDGYDTDMNWAMSYKIELNEDGTATCEGWRNKDKGTFDVRGNKVYITFDNCETDEEGNGYTPIKDYAYDVELTVHKDTADMIINTTELYNNLEGGTLYRTQGLTEGKSNDRTDAVENDEIADGVYITDETYTGEISKDGATLTITTALNHEDEAWNKVEDYKKSTYVFPTTKDSKCVIMQEEVEEYPISEQVEFINDFLKGNSALPITLIIKNGEVTEMQFSS